MLHPSTLCLHAVTLPRNSFYVPTMVARCARAVRKVGYFGPVFPDGQGDCGNHCVPMHRTAQILTQSKNSHNELTQTIFRTKNARLLSVVYLHLLFLPCGRMLPLLWVVFMVDTGQLSHSWALCLRCAEPPPMYNTPCMFVMDASGRARTCPMLSVRRRDCPASASPMRRCTPPTPAPVSLLQRVTEEAIQAHARVSLGNVYFDQRLYLYAVNMYVTAYNSLHSDQVSRYLLGSGVQGCNPPRVRSAVAGQSCLPVSRARSMSQSQTPVFLRRKGPDRSGQRCRAPG